MIALLLVLATGEPALIGNVELAAGAGHDTNIFLAATPDGAPVVGGWFGRLAPRLVGALALESLRLQASYALDYRATAAGSLISQRAELGLGVNPWSALKTSLTAVAGRLDASVQGPDRFWFAGAELAARLELAPSWRTAAAAEVNVRRFPDRASTELLGVGEARLEYRSDRLWGVELVRASALASGGTTILRAGPAGDLVVGPFTFAAWAWGGRLGLPGHPGIAQAGGGVGAMFRLATHVDLALTGDWTTSPGASDPAGAAYDRRYLALSVVAHAGGRAVFASGHDDADLAPLARAGKVRFRGRGAASVIGSWDQWQAPGVPLVAAGGVWEVWIPMAPGSHRYRFTVGGRAVRPPSAPRYVPDDFGGEDGVVEVPE